MKWDAYMNGQCSEEEEGMVEEHLETCSECEQLLNDNLVEQEGRTKIVNNQDDPLQGLSEKKQRRMIRKAKWKNRLSNAFTVISLFIIISVVSGVLTAFYYGFGGDEGRGATATQVVQTATQMTMPNVYVGGGGMNTNFYFTLDMDYTIQKQLGRERKAIGQLEGKMFFNRLNVNRAWADGQYDVKLYFLHPENVETQPTSEQNFYREHLDETWEALDYLPEGTVSELAITFDQLYDIDEVCTILNGYDLEIPWYAIDTGYEHSGDRSPYLSANNGVWGLHEAAIFDFSRGGGSVSVRGDGDVRAGVFKTGLQFLADNESLAKQYIWRIDREVSIKERYEYVVENGVKTYGVVVTGPTKELLQLQENEQIIYATLGEVDFWNWYHTPAGGTIYN
ncbi:anti-sigma factor [Bacillus shivajii]|uniref:anti-sigma factor n=1 Tax=Bacillus shivajii TaxID=1983719 RepID=UPI001CFB3E6E|nr:anti-sigma factor [Bacillus shivajii]UCZ51604.1 anti-sigma factor [Bacillus shivajii]